MQKIVAAIGFGILAVLCIMIYVTTTGKSMRSEELTNKVANSIEASVSTLMANEDKAYNISTRKEFVADFVESFVQQMKVSENTDNAGYDVTNTNITIAKVDEEKGLLTINVVVEYVNPNGSVGTVETQRTVIFDKEDVTVEKVASYSLTIFSDESTVWQKYELTEGSNAYIYGSPNISGFTGSYEDASGFVYTVNSDTNELIGPTGIPVELTTDLQLIASVS